MLRLPVHQGADRPRAAEGRGILVLSADQPGCFDDLVGFVASMAGRFGSLLRDAAARERLPRAAQTDARTGVGHRRRLDVLSQAPGVRAPARAPVAVVAVSLDRFKSVDDPFGHVAGDAVLRGTAQLPASAMRQDDSVLRLGGEAFVVLLPGSTGADAASAAEAQRTRLEAQRFPCQPGVALQVTASFGVDELVEGASLSAALQTADAALYEVKRLGRHRTRVADLDPVAPVHGPWRRWFQPRPPPPEHPRPSRPTRRSPTADPTMVLGPGATPAPGPPPA